MTNELTQDAEESATIEKTAIDTTGNPESVDLGYTSGFLKFGKEVYFEIERYCKKHNSDPSKNSVCTLDCGYEEIKSLSNSPLILSGTTSSTVKKFAMS